MNFRLNYKKKGSIVDGIFLTVIFFIFSIVIVTGFIVLNSINTEIQNTAGIPDIAKDELQKQNDRYVPLWDGIFITLYIFVNFIAVLGVFFLDIHPIFSIFIFLMVIVVPFIAGTLTEVYIEFANSNDIAPFESQFVIIPFVMNNYIIFALLSVFLIFTASFMGATRR